MGGNKSVTAAFVPGFIITATADGGSTITPSGSVGVKQGNSQTFVFSAISGFTITDVRIDGTTLLTQAQIDLGTYTFTNVTANRSIEVRTIAGHGGGDDDDTDDTDPTDDTNPKKDLTYWILALIILAVIAGILIWFFLYHNRKYDVIKVESSVKIKGDERVRRKSTYRFSIEGEVSGTVSYRIGEEGAWKAISPDAEGEYVIPRGEITDNVTLELR